MIRTIVEKLDVHMLGRFRHIEVPFARAALFVVYFWFGVLKAAGMSPATPMVQELHAQTISFIPFPAFYGIFAVFEITIGILFLVRGAERLALLLIAAHLVMTAMPLVLIPGTVWQQFLVPTLEGQYIIKNALIAALAVVVGAHARYAGNNDRTAEVL